MSNFDEKLCLNFRQSFLRPSFSSKFDQGNFLRNILKNIVFFGNKKIFFVKNGIIRPKKIFFVKNGIIRQKKVFFVKNGMFHNFGKKKKL